MFKRWPRARSTGALGALRGGISTPLLRRLGWLGFAVLFYHSGQAFTVWLLEPQNFAGGYRWLLLIAFPLLIPAFFVVNRRLGCAAGQCAAGRCAPSATHTTGRDRYPQPPPGV